MKRSRFTEEQITHALRRHESGEAAKDIARSLGVTETTLYAWKRKYGNAGVPELRRLKQQDDELSRLKRLVADLMLDKTMLQEVIRKKF